MFLNRNGVKTRISKRFQIDLQVSMILIGTFIQKTKFIEIGQKKQKPTRAFNEVFFKNSDLGKSVEGSTALRGSKIWNLYE